MKLYKIIPIILVLCFVATGCTKSLKVTKYEPVAVDKVYVKKQCPCFDHTFEIPGRKYITNNVAKESVVIPLKDLNLELVKNKKIKDAFNATVTEMNKEVTEKDPSNSKKRTIRKIYVDQVCPEYTYTPQFNEKRLTQSFVPDDDTIFVVIPLEDLLFQMEKYKMTKKIFNTTVKQLNETNTE